MGLMSWLFPHRPRAGEREALQARVSESLGAAAGVEQAASEVTTTAQAAKSQADEVTERVSARVVETDERRRARPGRLMAAQAALHLLERRH